MEAACYRGHHHVIEMLLTAGANIEAPNNEGQTPLYVACEKGHNHVVEIFLQYGANPETLDFLDEHLYGMHVWVPMWLQFGCY